MIAAWGRCKAERFMPERRMDLLEQ